MDIISILQLFGGLGLFLCGMSLMSSSLNKLAGSGLEKALEKVTIGKSEVTGRLKGWAFGTGVTGIIQSSAATTLMVCGFVNAGIMQLTQAIPVVFGSNVGSTVTGQILRLGDLGSDNIILQLLKPSSFAPMLVGIGAVMMLFAKKPNVKHTAGIIVGLGELFYGMHFMESVFEPLKESPKFQEIFVSFSNPFLGFLIGLVLTLIIQSSSASVGILQALSASGTVTYATTIPIVIGMNIGKCTPIVLGMLGSDKKAKRVSVSYILFNVFGAVVFMTVIYAIYYTVGIPAMTKVVNRGDIANFHLAFNLITSIFMLFFTKQIEKLCEKIIGTDEVSEQDKEFEKLDDLLLNTPTIALEQCRNLISKMGNAIFENYKNATSLIYDYDADKFPRLEENEAFIDKCETALSAYIIRIDRKRLTRNDKFLMNAILNSIGDLERMGDYCMNIAFVAREKNEQNIHFSPAGHKEVDTIMDAVEYTIDTVLTSFLNGDDSLATRVEPLAETIENLKEVIKSHHVDRLQAGTCSIEGGVSLFDLLTCFDRIAGHSKNIALHVVKQVAGDKNFDEMHGHAADRFSEEYRAMYHYYESQFIEPIEKPLTPEEIEKYNLMRKERESGKKTSGEAVTPEIVADNSIEKENAKNPKEGIKENAKNPKESIKENAKKPKESIKENVKKQKESIKQKAKENVKEKVKEKPPVKKQDKTKDSGKKKKKHEEK